MISRRKIAVGLGVCLVLVLFLALNHWSGKSRLEQWQADMRAKGEKLTFAELPPPRMTNGTPQYDKLIAAVASLQTTGAINPGNFSMILKFVSPGHARVAWKNELLDNNSNTNIWDELLDGINQNSGALQEIRESLQNPEPDLGWSYTNWTGPRINNFVAKRTAAQWLMGATLAHLHQNKLSLASDDLHALANFVRLHKDEPTLINQMIRVAIAGLGLSTTWEALQSPGWTDEQLARLQKDWEAIDLLEAMEKPMLYQRALGINTFNLVRSDSYSSLQSGILDRLKTTAWLATVAEEDEFFFLKTIQDYLEDARLLKAGTPWIKIKTLWTEADSRFENSSGYLQRYLHFFSLIMVPHFPRAYETSIHNETQRRLTVTAIALKRYELRHGNSPKNLAALVPEFLSALPIDCMDGQPLRYQLKPDGTAILYSVGDDGRDNGGDPTPAKPLAKKDEYNLWSGRDAVWPIAEMKTENLQSR